MSFDPAPWFPEVEGIIAQSLLMLWKLDRDRAEAVRTSGGFIQVASTRQPRSPTATSEPERFVLRNEKAIVQTKAFLDAVRPILLTWLEAAVLVHFYYRGLRLHEVARLVRESVQTVADARRSLVRKVAVALGYAPGEVERAGLPMAVDERRHKVAELRAQGLSWDEIGRRLGVSDHTARMDAEALRAQGVEIPARLKRGWIGERRKVRKDGTVVAYWQAGIQLGVRDGKRQRIVVTGRTREEAEAKLAAVLAEAEKSA